MSDTFVLRILRAEPGARARWVQGEVELDEGATLLDALELLRERGGPFTGLAFRAACRHGACGECSVEANGRGALSCMKTLGALAGRRRRVTVEPLRGLPVLRDLVVDRARFFAAFQSVRPWLVPAPALPTRENLMTPAELAAMRGADACILCGICAAACPVVQPHGAFSGPAAMLKLLGRANDPRDADSADRIARSRASSGAYRCHGALSCSEVCPRDLDPASAIVALRVARERPAPGRP